MCDTHGFTTAAGKIYPAHYRTPAISEADLTISAATDLTKTTRATVPASAVKKTTAHRDPQETPRHLRK